METVKSILFQFHKVRLKDGATGETNSNKSFQFHKVRLKEQTRKTSRRNS